MTTAEMEATIMQSLETVSADASNLPTLAELIARDIEEFGYAGTFDLFDRDCHYSDAAEHQF